MLSSARFWRKITSLTNYACEPGNPEVLYLKTLVLDITRERCPMTFVKTKLKLEQLETGDILEVLLTEGEPLDNVPKTAVEQGYSILETVHIKDNIHRVVIRK
jgi:TusA-related sulfurtransferase